MSCGRLPWSRLRVLAPWMSDSWLDKPKGHERSVAHAPGLCSTPYWTAFELPSIDVKAAAVGILDQIRAGLRWWSLREGRGGSGTRNLAPLVQ